MAQVVLSLPSDQIQKMQAYYQADLKPSPQHAAFAAKTSDCSITAYRSGKVVFQGKNPDAEAQKWGTIIPVSSRPDKVHSFFPPDSLYTSSHIGSDEAGTGDYFGPITVAAVYVDAEKSNMLKEMGVRDSKHLTDDKIQQIAKELVKHKVPYSLVILHNEKYNTLQRKGWTQGKMKTMLHHHAISNLMEKIVPVEPEGILIDQFSEPDVYIKHLKSEKKQLQKRVYFRTKAESYSLSVAAGSIIARASFVKEMEKLSEKTGVSLPKGASKKVDEAAASLIHQYGSPILETCAKVHFANTKKAELIAEQKS